MEWLETLWNNFVEWSTTKGIKLVLALIVLFILFKIVNLSSKKIRNKLLKKKVDKTVVSVVYFFLRKGVKIILFLVFLAYVGVDTSSVGTIIASIGVTLGLALQGSLSNLAGGILLLVTHPFKIDDFIEANGMAGTVEEISVFYTYLVTPDNKVVSIPNGQLMNTPIINYSKKETRRVDVAFSISYEADYEKAKSLIEKAMGNTNLVLNEPKPFIRMTKHADSAVEITAKLWVKKEDYWTVYFQMLEDVKKYFDENKVEIPYNQLDVNIHNKDEKKEA